MSLEICSSLTEFAVFPVKAWITDTLPWSVHLRVTVSLIAAGRTRKARHSTTCVCPPLPDWLLEVVHVPIVNDISYASCKTAVRNVWVVLIRIFDASYLKVTSSIKVSVGKRQSIEH